MGNPLVFLSSYAILMLQNIVLFTQDDFKYIIFNKKYEYMLLYRTFCKLKEKLRPETGNLLPIFLYLKS